MADEEEVKVVESWRDVGFTMGGMGAALVTLLMVKEEFWLGIASNIGPLLFIGGMAILFIDKIFPKEK